MPPRLAVLVAAVAAAIVLTPAPAAAAARWDDTTVTYRDGSKYDHAVAQAVRWINDLPGPLTLRRARRDEHADIVIRRVRRRDVDWVGRSSFPPFGEVELNAAFLSDPRVDAVERADVTVHELLHAVGVDHLSGCTVLHPSRSLRRRACNRGLAAGTYRCGPQRADAREVVERYGGRVGDFAGYRCDADDVAGRGT